jgi:hypothetical protein
MGVIGATGQLLGEIRDLLPGAPYPFYYGWAIVHSNWGPVAFTYSTIVGRGVWPHFYFYFNNWMSPILAIAIFALFGLTSEARATYWRSFYTIAKHFGWVPPAPKHEDVGEIQFGVQQMTTTEQCALKRFALNFTA